MTSYPEWLHVLAILFLVVAVISALVIVVDEFRRLQKMMIMNFVWPITALYWGPLALWGYFRSGLKMTKERQHTEQKQKQTEQPKNQPPTAEQTAVADTHCGAGCTLGDIISEWGIFLLGLSFIGGEFGTRLVLDFVLAWTLGIVFQYFTIVPMRGLSFKQGLLEAMRADTLSIISFEIGLFGWMALTYYVFFPSPHLKPTESMFWFMMQVGMIIGFFTSYPVNAFLVRKGWKEKMPQESSTRQPQQRAA